MLIKEEGTGWFDKRINFIDKNDCFVGFAYAQSCCENFGYFITNEMKASREGEDLSLEGFWFDTSVEPEFVEPEDKDNYYYASYNGAQAFKCINEYGDVRYLHLYNHHNGYYSHGWEASWGVNGSL